jgi:hypothetical protein
MYHVRFVGLWTSELQMFKPDAGLLQHGQIPLDRLGENSQKAVQVRLLPEVSVGTGGEN